MNSNFASDSGNYISNNPREYVLNPSKMQLGNVNSQASKRFFKVSTCTPERLATIDPAIPDESIWVVLTGNPK